MRPAGNSKHGRGRCMMEFDITSLSNIHIGISSIFTIYHQVHPKTAWHTIMRSRQADGLALVLDGAAIYDFDDRKVQVSRNEVLYLRKGDTYESYNADTSPQCYTIILINFEFADPKTASLLPLTTRIPLQSDSPIPDLFDEMLTIWNIGGPFTRIRISSILYSILYQLAMSCIQNELYTISLSKIIKSVKFMESHYHEPVSLAALAAESHLSVSHFIRIFTQTYSIPPIEYLNRVRIKHARRLLRCQLYTISEVAEKAGFHSLHYFSRVFHNHEGISPSAYQQATNSDKEVILS
jgi:AraC family transcriptional regulator, arabinose operon regulatory protein